MPSYRSPWRAGLTVNRDIEPRMFLIGILWKRQTASYGNTRKQALLKWFEDLFPDITSHLQQGERLVAIVK